MLKKIRQTLRNVKWLHRIHLFYWAHIRTAPMLVKLAVITRPILIKRYAAQVKRLREKYGKEKINVLFLVTNPSKWKCQTVFEKMIQSGRYKPCIALTAMDIECSLSLEMKKQHFMKTKDYFMARGMDCVFAYDLEKDEHVSLEKFSPDIVWYQVPELGSRILSPEEVSRYALTCYVEYYVPDYGIMQYFGTRLHRTIWRNFTLNQDWADLIMRYQNRFFRAGETIGTGHPILDVLNIRLCVHGKDDGLIIYAPHWSCGVGEKYSTFMKNGKKILELARKTPEVKWAFKPHPTLRRTLLDNNLMTERDINDYYASWEKIAETCYDGSYPDLFQRSSALITDCGSFLVEYACTQKPIIHLISSECPYSPVPTSARLFNTYYKARNWKEFVEIFQRVIIRGDDFKKGERQAMVKKMGLCHSNAAKNIVSYLDEAFSGRLA